MLSELLTALAEPSPRTRAAVGGDRLDEFLRLPSGERLRVIEREMAQFNDDEYAEFLPHIAAELQPPFIPVVGPQERAFNSQADELLYGGSSGGGKSLVLLGIAAAQHTRSLILRRQLTETDGLADELVKMLGRDGYNKNDREHIGCRPDGGERSIKLGGINGPDDWQSYAGRARDAMCVAAGTPVLMASGCYAPVEAISCGDMVATLEGPRRVRKVHPVQHKPCVRLRVRDGGHTIIASQIQAASHAVLTDRGWLSSADLDVSIPPRDAESGSVRYRGYSQLILPLARYVRARLGHFVPFPPSLVVDDPSDWHQPISARESDNTSVSSAQTFAVPELRLIRVLSDQWRRAVSSQVWRCFLDRSVAHAGIARRGVESGFETPCDRTQSTARPVSNFQTLLALLRPSAPLFWPFGRHLAFAHAKSCADALSESLGSTDHCSFYSRQHDARLPRYPHRPPGSDDARQCLLLLPDAERPNPNRWQANGQAEIRECSHSPPRTYVHPYTKQRRPIAESCSVQCAPFNVLPVGWADVYDLEVEEVNHYITQGGIVNKNCFDEAGEFLEVQVVSLLAWLRSTDPSQRCRVVFASNPPRGVEGQWLIEWFAPWIEPTFSPPAKDGELRWFIFPKSKTRWVEGPGEYEVDGETYTAKSRTFIRARLSDNPFLSRDNVYLAQLQNRPEPLRSQLLHGDFLAGREDDAWQVIPADWVQQARQRWTPTRPDMAMTTLGIDVAQGGADRTCLAARHGSWFAPVKTAPGDQTPDGLSVATLAFGAMRDGCTVVVDMGGGWGGDAYGHLSRHLPEDALVPFMGINPSHKHSANGIERFANLRAEAWWRFREALDPATGADIALPPDPELAAELTMPRRVPERREIQVESKEQIIRRLGRSPDKADAVVMAWCYGTERAQERTSPLRLQTRQNVGYDSAKRRRR